MMFICFPQPGRWLVLGRRAEYFGFQLQKNRRTPSQAISLKGILTVHRAWANDPVKAVEGVELSSWV